MDLDANSRHMNRGLYAKYIVLHNTDVARSNIEDLESEGIVRQESDPCFVLVPNRDKAGLVALAIYAILTPNSNLRRDLQKMMADTWNSFSDEKKMEYQSALRNQVKQYNEDGIKSARALSDPNTDTNAADFHKIQSEYNLATRAMQFCWAFFDLMKRGEPKLKVEITDTGEGKI